MKWIGLKNLRRDPTRLIVAVLGVIFAVVLVLVEAGMLFGMVSNSSQLIDRSKADLWVCALNVKTFDFAKPMDQRKLYRIQSIPGVESVEEFILSFTTWRLPSGGTANCQVVGLDPHGQLATTLKLVKGSMEDLHNQDAVIIDQRERSKLENPNLGDWVEIFDHRAQVVGFTDGMRSFTTTPYIFTSLQRARKFGYLAAAKEEGGGTKSIYFLVKVQQGADLAAVRSRIQNSVSGIQVYSRKGFSDLTQRYWLVETGVGLGFLAAALLGLLVGGVIVSQTLYAMTVERLPEFAVLKAMGASMFELARIVLEQGLICALLGFTLGFAIAIAVAVAARAVGTAMIIPIPLVAGVAVLTAILCSIASMISILRLRRLEPATVFRT